MCKFHILISVLQISIAWDLLWLNEYKMCVEKVVQAYATHSYSLFLQLSFSSCFYVNERMAAISWSNIRSSNVKWNDSALYNFSFGFNFTSFCFFHDLAEAIRSLIPGDTVRLFRMKISSALAWTSSFFFSWFVMGIWQSFVFQCAHWT
jgi:hypothetical protein